MFKKVYIYLKQYFLFNKSKDNIINNPCLKYVSEEDYLYLIEKANINIH